MKYIFIVCIFVPVGAIAQISFEKGYIVDQSGQKTECLIRNTDWLRTPDAVRYKLTETGDVFTGTVSDVKEFGVAGHRFVRVDVKMDTSSQLPKSYSELRAPAWKDVTPFLRVLVDGKGSLYEYDDGLLRLFFFSVDGSPIEQLVYKHYTYKDKRDNYRGKVVINKTYANQLVNQVLCGERPIETKFRYRADYLTKHFVKYNQCSGAAFTQQPKRKSGSKIHLRLTPGLDWATGRTTDTRDEAYPSRAINWRAGAELEVELPFNKRKWGLVLEPAYQSYSHDEFALNYSSVEVFFGPRHYFFLNNNMKIFLNAGVVTDLALTLESKRTAGYKPEFDKIHINAAGGVGGTVGRFSVEARYYTVRSGMDSIGSMFYDYKKATLIFGVRLF